MAVGRPRNVIQVSDRERIANDILAQLKYEGKLSEDQLSILMNTLDSTLAEYNIEKETTPVNTTLETNSSILDMFIAAKRIESRSSTTLYNYQNEISKLFQLINKPVREIDSNDIRRYMDYRKTHDNLKNSSVQNIRMYLLSFFKWCMIEELIDKNPMDKIGVVKTEKKVVNALTDEEQEMIRCACSNERDLAIIDLLSSSGMRVSELCGLNISDVDFDNNEVKVFGKGSKERICFFTGRAKVHLKWYLEQREDNNPALFVTAKHPYTRLTKNGVEYLLRTIAANSKVDKLRLYPHLYRSTLATNLSDREVDISRIQAILGHASPETTEIYIRDNKSAIKRTHSKYIS